MTNTSSNILIKEKHPNGIMRLILNDCDNKNALSENMLTSLVDAIKIPANSAWFANIPNTTVADLTCVTSSSTVNCVVAALINDIA